ncbi:Sensor protein ZraS [Planctomycetes bacterium MalM25]|nr:Sensor protein ZraS [Planctomycetes bacterium MalM25]
MESPPPITDEQRRWFAEELQRAKLDAMKELAYGASHEINNPLANIALRAQTMLKREDDADKRKALEAMHRAAMRAHEMISDLMLFARPPKLERQPIDLAQVAETVVEELAPRAEELAIEVRVSKVSAPVSADPDQLAVALRAVVENSFDALGQGGEVAIESEGVNGDAYLRVHDNGPGVPEAIRPHVFDPFFSGREAGRGLGFGLPKCWRIVTDHGGDVRLDSGPAGGVTVTIRLPAVADDHA